MESQAGTARNTDPAADLSALLAAQRRAFRAHGAPALGTRLARLETLAGLLSGHRDAFVKAISADFGHRSRHETLIADIVATLEAIRHTRRNLPRWMKPERRGVSINFLPGRAKVVHQPLGVVGIISPWNYPVQLAFSPLAAAMAAGNRVMLKPSEFTPATSDLMARLLGEAFPADEIAVVTGGPEVGRAFSELAFDHLLFTGATAVGRHVARAAAANLVPVTLELGGKSPVIVDDNYPMDRAAAAIMTGKMLNAGQTCIAPDYVLVPHARIDAFVHEAQRAVRTLYPTLKDNPDYTSVVNQRHYDRLHGLIADARDKGARIVEINPANEHLDQQAHHKIAPTLVLGATPDMKVMQDEIFGPVLPVQGYGALEDAFEAVAAGDRPLALYYFGLDPARQERVLNETISGGVTINDTLMHVAQEDLPFGGVGASGMGAYHGRDGFLTFSHRKGVFVQSKFSLTRLLRPPYGKLAERALARMTR